jgi:hypothetical protein
MSSSLFYVFSCVWVYLNLFEYAICLVLCFSLVKIHAYIEKDNSKDWEQKWREKLQQKMGKVDIDYQVGRSFAYILDIYIYYCV